MTMPDWRDGFWRYTAEVANAIVVIYLVDKASQLAGTATSHLYKSSCDFKSATTKGSTAELAGVNVAKALQESPEQAALSSREADFVLSTQWTPKGYFCCGPKIISYAPGMTYSSKVPFKIRYEALDYVFTLEGKKDKGKDKDKDKGLNYRKLASAIGIGQGRVGSDELGMLDEEPPKKKDEKQPVPIRVLQNASIVIGEGGAQLGWGTKLEITTDIGFGQDKTDPGTAWCEFRIAWKESTATARFEDTVSIKCYASGKVTTSSNFSKACATASAVKADLALDDLNFVPLSVLVEQPKLVLGKSESILVNLDSDSDEQIIVLDDKKNPEPIDEKKKPKPIVDETTPLKQAADKQ